ncbi:hypothetical protein [Methanolobus bombayensis]|jgi:uncharacterized membrane protein|uniref:hypothetical protein n=1 Tax=Methanolobus bombayensis TaxID=38023 RepID=UPI001FD8084F|nr:hypothetical protein [Methanolobus bombayensis]MBP1908214.1 putative membrane protein [Methanolobus bombayensis]
MLDYELLLKNSWNVVKENIVTFVVGLLITAIGSILIVTIAPLFYGFTSMAIKGARGEMIEINDVFVGFSKDNFIRSWTFMIIYLVVAGILGEIASILSTIIGILFMFSMPLLVIKEGTGGIEAITESIEIVKTSPVESIVVYVITIVLNMIGALLLGIGLLITAPISTVILAYATFELAE